jgi:Protein of unknown function (DUF3592)
MRFYFALVGIACLIASVFLLVRRLGVMLAGARATGVVVGFVTSEDDGTVTYSPKVEYPDDQGRKHTFSSGAGGTQRKPPIGSEVMVRYAPDAPDRAYIVSFLHMWAAPIAFFVLGVGAMLTYLGG